ncbi:MAG: phosphoribosylanthranilate isomerase, partial [Dehalococcoidia bacterium]|nr:phosphoribosylanthranilate isomerase [Dehalococcoidia bacterium]
MTQVKACGIRTPEHALVAAATGVDMIGMIFASQSTRTVTPEEARRIVAAVRAAVGHNVPALAGVFVNEQPERINELADFCGLDLVQLSGDEPWDTVEQVSRPVIKALRVPSGRPADDVLEELDRHWSALNTRGGRCLIESHVAGRYGGTGRQIDWAVAASVAARFPIILSGGLTTENVSDAIQTVQPWGVDVSSGIETGGVKDPEKIRAFIAAA